MWDFPRSGIEVESPALGGTCDLRELLRVPLRSQGYCAVWRAPHPQSPLSSAGRSGLWPFSGIFPERGPASGLLSCEAASAGSCHSEELLLDDTRVHRRDGAYTGRACGCPWPLAGKCPPIAVMWAEAREALRECPPAPQEDSRAPRLPSAPASQRSLQRSSMESSASEPPVPL